MLSLLFFYIFYSTIFYYFPRRATLSGTPRRASCIYIFIGNFCSGGYRTCTAVNNVHSREKIIPYILQKNRSTIIYTCKPIANQY